MKGLVADIRVGSGCWCAYTVIAFRKRLARAKSLASIARAPAPCGPKASRAGRSTAMDVMAMRTHYRLPQRRVQKNFKSAEADRARQTPTQPSSRPHSGLCRTSCAWKFVPHEWGRVSQVLAPERAAIQELPVGFGGIRRWICCPAADVIASGCDGRKVPRTPLVAPFRCRAQRRWLSLTKAQVPDSAP